MQLPGRVAQVRIAVQLYSLPGSQVGVQQSWHHTPWILPGSLLPPFFQFLKRPEDQQVYLAFGAGNFLFVGGGEVPWGQSGILQSGAIFLLL